VVQYGYLWKTSGSTVMEFMTDDSSNSLAGLESAINYHFVDRSLLTEALTHRSFVNESGGKWTKDNQRLEFFGDAVIDFLLSRMLLERFPDSREGDLTKIRASLVDEGSLASLAEEIGLGAFLKLGRGEERSGGRGKRSLLADAYEALMAAVYLDGGIEPVQRLVEAHFARLLAGREVMSAGRDFKTDFQELAHALRGSMPRYVLRGISGPDHERRFTVALFIGDELMGEGAGRSKKEAEQAAAREGIARLESIRITPS